MQRRLTLLNVRAAVQDCHDCQQAGRFYLPSRIEYSKYVKECASVPIKIV